MGSYCQRDSSDYPAADWHRAPGARSKSEWPDPAGVAMAFCAAGDSRGWPKEQKNLLSGPVIRSRFRGIGTLHQKSCANSSVYVFTFADGGVVDGIFITCCTGYINHACMTPNFADRDVSWLSFNERVLEEAAQQNVPLPERLKFLSIFSSNLDEFYRVRMPALMALHRLKDGSTRKAARVLDEVNGIIHRLQERFGYVRLLMNEPLPAEVLQRASTFFKEVLAGHIEMMTLHDNHTFFPENNRLYLWVMLKQPDGTVENNVVCIHSHRLPRFFACPISGVHYILFIDDIIANHLEELFEGSSVVEAFTSKITRDAELDLKDEYEGNLVRKIEREIEKRDLGLATRVLHPALASERAIKTLAALLNVQRANFVAGGQYHNLKDLATVPLPSGIWKDEAWPRQHYPLPATSLFDYLQQNEVLLHPPFHRYEPVIRFFNEAAIDARVKSIHVTLYRVAQDSRIVQALITAANNGKKVVVFVELKARFDEENNLMWARRLRQAGAKVMYSLPGLKVHAKVALVKRTTGNRTQRYGVFSTGNFNESTARFYTDHVLLTARHELLAESELLFRFLANRKKWRHKRATVFSQLLVAQFNLQTAFIRLIEEEMVLAREGKPAAIMLKMNNLEEEVMITKLCEAAQAGVKITLIVRGICRLMPDENSSGSNIVVRRIVDRYLEHGRVFVFNRGGNRKVYLGSADWMNRNIYRRIEVCFPIEDEKMKQQLITMLELQAADDVKGTALNELPDGGPTKGKRSQWEISRLMEEKSFEFAGREW